jgi:hypothetical protein
MMQLIHDVAPGADLAFQTAFNGQAGFANGILDLANDAGADVIVDDVIFFAEPMFQDGIIAQAVDTVVASGVSYFSSAGNAARRSYESEFVNSNETLFVDSGSGPENRGILHDFDPGPGVDWVQDIYIPLFSTVIFSFQWDEPFYSVSGGSGSASDLDFYITDSLGTTLYDSSINRNIGSDPVEVFQFTNGVDLFGSFGIMIANYGGGPDPGLLKYVRFDLGPAATSNIQYDTLSGTSYGHANAAGAEAVGAAYYGDTPEFEVDPAVLETFSSAGGTPILFDIGGMRLPSPVIRETPDIVAPDGTDTTFFGQDTDGNGFPNFFGTSAAAPHAAAVAALMLELNPGLSPDDVYSALESTALDMGVAGFDDDSGYGLIQADLALATVSSVPRLTLSIDAAAISENGGSTFATVTRWGVDTSASLDVTLASNDTGEAVIDPANVITTISAGETSASFTINAVDDLLSDGTQTVTVTATAAGLFYGNDTLQVTDDEPQLVSQWASTVIDFSTQWDDPNNPGAWQAIQALGEPDTFQYGDIETAWEPSTPDGNGVEYLTLGYTTPVFSSGVIVRETFGNGYVTQIDVFEAGTGTPHTVWSGTDPSPQGTPVDFLIQWPSTNYLVDAVKVTINSNHVNNGWEAIDAVQLQGWDQMPPATVTIAATDSAAAENPLDTGTFTVTRSNTDGVLIVSYSIDPSSTAGVSDYESLSGSVQIANGQSSATIILTPVDDLDEEGDETLTLTLVADVAYQVGSPASATVTISDDDLTNPDITASAETPVDGIVSGDLPDTLSNTFSSDENHESIQEETYAGNKRSRL